MPVSTNIEVTVKMKTTPGLQEKIDKLRSRRTKASAIDYAAEFLSGYNATQGYYDYFHTKRDELGGFDVFTAHYRGNIYGFKYEGETEDGKLAFSANGTASFDDVILCAENYEKVKEGLFKEIRERATADVTESITELINSFTGKYCDEKLQFFLSVNWKLKSKN